MEEKRKYKRVSVNAIILYQIQNYENEEKNNLSRIRSPLSVDISEGGLKIDTDQKLPEGTYLKITLSIVPTKITIDIIGKIAWTRDSETEGHFQSGVEFVEFTDESQKGLIKTYIDLKD